MGILNSIRRFLSSNKEKPKLETQKPNPSPRAGPPPGGPRGKEGVQKSGQQGTAARGQDPLDKFFPLANRFIGTESWEDAGLFVRFNPDLLSDEACLVIQKIASIQPDEGARGFVENHRLFLELCKEIGIDSAVNQVVAIAQKPQARMVSLDHIGERLRMFINTPSAGDRRRLLAENTELMFAATNAVITKMAEDETNSDKRGRIEDSRKLLQRCREVGIDAAFAEIPPAKSDASRQQEANAQIGTHSSLPRGRGAGG